MRNLLFLVITLFAISLYADNEQPKNNKDVIMEFGDFIKAKYGLSFRWADIDRDHPEKKIDKFAFLFSTDVPMSKDKARSLVLNVLKDCVEFINLDKEGKDLFATWPFPTDKVVLCIFTENVKNQEQSFVHNVGVFDGLINYKTTNPSTQNETYETETLRKAYARAKLRPNRLNIKFNFGLNWPRKT